MSYWVTETLQNVVQAKEKRIPEFVSRGWIPNVEATINDILAT
jgi:hypothetical protein